MKNNYTTRAVPSAKPGTAYRMLSRIPAILLMVFLLSAFTGWGQPLMEENFNFTTTNLVGTNGWTQLGTAASPKIQVTEGSGLIYSGYAGSEIGNAASLAPSGDDAIKSFTSQNSGTVYHSMLVNVSASQTNGDYFTFAYDGTTNYRMRVFIKTSGSGFIFGMLKGSSGTVTYESTVRTYNTTYLLVFGYKFVSGTINDEGYLWVNPPIGGTEPAATLGPITDVTQSDLTQCIAFPLRQGNASNAATLKVDGIRIATDWATAVAPSNTIALVATPNTLNGFSYIQGGGPSASQSYSLNGQYLTPPSGNITVTGTTDYEVSTNNSIFSVSVNIPYTSGTLAETPVYVRLKSGLTLGNYFNENVTNTGGGAPTANVTCNGAVVLPEPTNYPTNFLAGTVTTIAIPLTWTDATGGILPTAYLVKASTVSYEAISQPVDLTPEPDGALVKNVAAGVGTVTFTGLQPGMTYYFKIWPYTNSGTFVDYKVDGTVPAQSATTLPLYFRSAASGNWNSPATWEISNDNFTWGPANTEIPVYQTSDVTIRNGHSVTVPLSYNSGTTKNLTVESGATLYANSATGACFVYVHGNILNDGIIGGAADVLGFDIEGASCDISGSGSFIVSRMAKYTNANAITNFTINQNVTLNYTNETGNALYNNLSGTTMFNITLNAGKHLTVSIARVNLTGCTLTLKSDNSGTASLLVNNAINGMSGTNVTVERYINGWTDAMHGWHMISSPVTNQAVAPAFTDPTPANYDFYKWDEVNNIWLNQKEAVNGIINFAPGTGYLVAYLSAGTRQFNGSLNNADVTVSNLTISGGANSGWNLAGNPFPCALVWNNGTSWDVPVDIADLAKIWDESSAAYVDIDPGDIIPSMNGFMVQVLSGSPASMIIPKAARTQDATPWYKNAEGSIELIAYDRVNNTAQQSVIRVNDQATEGYDAAFDSRFLAGYAPQFYSVAGEETLSTNALPDLENGRVIEMGFVKNNASEFSIGLNTENMIPGLVVYLTDKKTGTVTELTQSQEYTFTSSEGDASDRFRLHFGALGIDDPASGQLYDIYTSQGFIYISSKETIKADVSVSNLAGQVVLRGNTSGDDVTVIDANTLKNGIYVVSIKSAGQVSNRKIYFIR